MGKNGSKYEYIDYVFISDNAYGFVGAVLFCDNDRGTSNIALFDKDGYYQECGTFAKLSDNAEFTYLGDGTVSFQLDETDGEVSTIKFTYTSDNNGNVCWIVDERKS